MKFSLSETNPRNYTQNTALLAFRHVLLLNTVILLMEEILHQLVGSLSHCSQGFYTSQVVVWDF